MMGSKLTFTLDTNCLIALFEKEPAGDAVQRIFNAALSGEIDAAIVASSAAERQKGQPYLANIDAFKQRLAAHGLAKIQLLPPMLRWDVGFLDHAIWLDDQVERREGEIFGALFPNRPLEWSDWAISAGVDINDTTSKDFGAWKNCIIDTHIFEAHVRYSRDVFVTSDRNFFTKLALHPVFGDFKICTPAEAVELFTAK
ncbi:MAG: hypothetical protein ACJAVR_003944 [Paracoccaceae bacterium]|jgi:hypothetical protein